MQIAIALSLPSNPTQLAELPLGHRPLGVPYIIDWGV